MGSGRIDFAKPPCGPERHGGAGGQDEAFGDDHAHVFVAVCHEPQRGPYLAGDEQGRQRRDGPSCRLAQDAIEEARNGGGVDQHVCAHEGNGAEDVAATRGRCSCRGCVSAHEDEPCKENLTLMMSGLLVNKSAYLYILWIAPAEHCGAPACAATGRRFQAIRRRPQNLEARKTDPSIPATQSGPTFPSAVPLASRAADPYTAQ